MDMAGIQEKTNGLPLYDLKVAERDGRRWVFDAIRRKYVAFTPEEWVRQQFVRYLTDGMGYPRGAIANEVTLRLYRTTKRCDTVVFDPYSRPWMVIEYKAPTVELGEEVFRQIMRYNEALHATYLVVSNGRRLLCCQMDYETGSCRFLPGLPRFWSETKKQRTMGSEE